MRMREIRLAMLQANNNKDLTLFTGTEDVGNNDLKIYPNPFTGEVRMISGVEKWRAASLQIINTAGVVVDTQKISGPDEVIHLEHLLAGVYFFVIEDGKQLKTMRGIKN